MFSRQWTLLPWPETIRRMYLRKQYIISTKSRSLQYSKGDTLYLNSCPLSAIRVNNRNIWWDGSQCNAKTFFFYIIRSGLMRYCCIMGISVRNASYTQFLRNLEIASFDLQTLEKSSVYDGARKCPCITDVNRLISLASVGIIYSFLRQFAVGLDTYRRTYLVSRRL